MKTISVYKKDGTIDTFRQKENPGGPDIITVKFEGNFVIVADAWSNKTVFPSDTIEKVVESGN